MNLKQELQQQKSENEFLQKENKELTERIKKMIKNFRGEEVKELKTNTSLQQKIKEDIKTEAVDAANILAIVENYMKNEEYKKAQMYAEKLLCKLTAINTAQDILRRWEA